MSDDWSLKNKSTILDERGLLHRKDDLDIDDYTFYYKEDIEILRKKLMEDFFNPDNRVGLLLYNVAQCYSFSKEEKEKFSEKLYKDISELINKRFGVEE